MLRSSAKILLVLSVLILLGAVGLKWRYGGGVDFPDRSGPPQLRSEALALVAELDWPPGNIAVGPSGRVFFTLHPEARPPLQLVEWRDGAAQPYPNAGMQASGDHPDRINEVLSIRIDRQNRLWALDNGTHGLKAGRLLAFDLDSGELTHKHTFSREIAGIGSHLNDFQVAPDGQTIYIAEASFFGQSPALIVYDLVTRTARRVVEGHESVDPEFYTPVVQGRRMEALGLVAIRPGVDSIALSEDGQWLYFAPVTNNYLYRARTQDLRDGTLDAASLARRIERYALKTMSDGLAMDQAGNIYLSDLEHSAIVQLTPERELVTLLRDERLRWPDGFSFGPDGWLYVACSSLHQVIGLPPSSVRKHRPYQVFRFQPGYAGTPGH